MLLLFLHYKDVMGRLVCPRGFMSHVHLVESDCKRQQLWKAIGRTVCLLGRPIRFDAARPPACSMFLSRSGRHFLSLFLGVILRNLAADTFFFLNAAAWRELIGCRSNEILRPGKMHGRQCSDSATVDRTPTWKMKLFPADCDRGTSGSTDVHH